MTKDDPVEKTSRCPSHKRTTSNVLQCSFQWRKKRDSSSSEELHAGKRDNMQIVLGNPNVKCRTFVSPLRQISVNNAA